MRAYTPVHATLVCPRVSHALTQLLLVLLLAPLSAPRPLTHLRLPHLVPRLNHECVSYDHAHSAAVRR